MTSTPAIKRKLAAWMAAALTATGALALPAAAQAQAPAHVPGVVGIDHVGINVPNLDQAIAFFHDVLGFEPVTRLGPFPLNADWKRQYHLHDGADQVTLVMLRAGDGANIELFGYTPASGSTEQPWRDDIGATHIALYTNDIDASRTWLEAKGIHFLTGTNSGGGDTDGERWVYFETPWGASIELNSYPNGKGYEKHDPKVTLWAAASAVQLTTAAPAPADLQALAANQFRVWNEPDAQARLARMKDVYRDDVAFLDHDRAIHGLADLNARITALQREHAGYKFTPGRVDSSGNVVRLYWHYGPASDPRRIAGMDLIVLEQGRIRSLNTFIDPPVKGKP